MQHYKEIFSDEIYFLNYDHLVTFPEKEIKSLTTWLNWEWNEKFLNPESNIQAFNTASIVEVRSKINNKSVGGWKNYRKLLEPAHDYLTSKRKEIPDFFRDQFLF